jgi:integrase
MARLPSYITRAQGKRGVTYEARINATLTGGRRLQNRKRFATVDEAKDWHSTTMSELAAGTHTAPSDLTVRGAVEAWLAAKAARVKPTTADAYTAALQPVVDRYGDVLAQKITKHDVEVLVTELRTGATDRGVWKRTSINPMLARWKKVWGDLHAQGILARNVVALVEPLRKPSGEPAMKVDDSRTEAKVEQLVAVHAEGAGAYARRREPFVHLALRPFTVGMRPRLPDVETPRDRSGDTRRVVRALRRLLEPQRPWVLREQQVRCARFDGPRLDERPRQTAPVGVAR